MKRRYHCAAFTLLTVAAVAGSANAQPLSGVQIQRAPTEAQAQTQTPIPLQSGPTLPAVPQPQQPSPPVAISQPLSIVAGTGVLLHLSQAAATVMSADPTIARVQPASPTSLFLMGVAPGRTTVVATNQSGAAITQYDITVTQGAGHAAALPGGPPAPAAGVSPATAAAAQAAIARTVTGGNNVRATAAGNDIVLTGTVPSAIASQQAEAIARAYVGDKSGVVDSLTVLSTIQVNVRVRIAEIDRTVTRQLGFNWQALGSGNGWRFGLRTGAAVLGTITPLAPLGLTPLPNNAPSPNQFGAGLTSGNGAWDVNAIVDALAADQLITVLAEPNLTAQSGETASFLAGGEFPVPISGNTVNGGVSISVEFKQFGVSLALVPTVLSPTRLNLRVRPEVSQLSTTGAVSVPIGPSATITIPALTVRRAETTVELGSGQSFAIAGLLQRSSNDLNNALPGIGELPVIGALFKSNDFQRGESELVIIVTPYIVQPAPSPEALRLPTDGFRPATDLDRILFGRQMAPPLDGQAVDAGFILK